MGGGQGRAIQATQGQLAQDPIVGLVNFGSTCYANSVLQALFACTTFRQKMLEHHESNSKRRKDNGSLLSVLAALFANMASHRKRGAISPTKMMRTARRLNHQFQGSSHQDVQEFLNFVLNEVADCLRREQEEEAKAREGEEEGYTAVFPAAQRTWVQGIFEGTLENETTCLRCENVTCRDELFLDLSLDIAENTSLTHCLRTFSAEEMLRGSDKYYCSSCRCHQEAAKCMRIKVLPQVVVCHLKRFKYEESLDAFQKLCYRVVFPLELRLVNQADDAEDADRLYDLIAVVVHIGSDTTYGHYVCIVKHGEAWYLHDDESAKEVEVEALRDCFGSIHSKNDQDGYLLFYQFRPSESDSDA